MTKPKGYYGLNMPPSEAREARAAQLAYWVRLFVDNARYLEEGNPESVLARMERDKARKVLVKLRALMGSVPPACRLPDKRSCKG